MASVGSACRAAPATRWASARGAGGAIAPLPPSRSPVDRARAWAPRPARSNSGSLTSAPRRRSSETDSDRVVSRPCRTRSDPSGLAGEPVAGPTLGEQRRRADHRDDEERRSREPDADPERFGRDAPGRVVDDADVARVDAGLDQQVEPRTDHGADPGERGERQGREPQPRPVQPGDLRGRALRGRGGGGRAIEQHLPQVFGLGGADGVEVDLGGAVQAGRPARRADPHDAQPEDPVQRGRREVDGADAVAGHRAALAAQPAGAQLDAVAGDPVAGGPPAQHAGEHHDRGTADGHPDLDEITGTAREQDDDGEREQLQQVLERPDHEHARVEAPPRR